MNFIFNAYNKCCTYQISIHKFCQKELYWDRQSQHMWLSMSIQSWKKLKRDLWHKVGYNSKVLFKLLLRCYDVCAGLIVILGFFFQGNKKANCLLMYYFCYGSVGFMVWFLRKLLRLVGHNDSALASNQIIFTDV